MTDRGTLRPGWKLGIAVAIAGGFNAAALGAAPGQSDEPGTGRTQLLERLCAELEPRPGSAWTIVEGCPRVPELPAAMIGVGSRLCVATEDRIESYDVEGEKWEGFLRLPERVGAGVAMTTDGEDTVYLASGNDRPSVWRLSIRKLTVRRLPDSPVPIGYGAAIAFSDGTLYLASGRRQEDFLTFEEGASEWKHLGRIGGKSPLHTGFGRTSGFLAKVGSGLYAWPDHHIHRFDLEKERWKDGNWLAMDFLPSVDGGGVAAVEAGGSVFVACGTFSRSLNEIVPAKRQTGFLRPRLPYPMIGDGSRLAVAHVGGEPHLFVYAIEPDNELCHIPLSRLKRVTKSDDVADEGSPWRRLHYHGGGNGVRRWDTRLWKEELGPMHDAPRTAGTLGVMGALGREVFYLRRAFVRRMQPDTGIATHYPGINLGRTIALGAAAVFDGDRHLYVCTGRSDYFLRWAVPVTPPERKLKGPQPPIDHTDLEVLPPMPADNGRCAALAHRDGMIYATRGGATRDFWRFRVAERRWDVLAPLPPEALAPGERGAGLVASALGVFSVSDDEVWRYDVATDRWDRFAELGFGPHWDGGMVADDGERFLYVVRGGISTRLGRLDLRSRRFEELRPRVPDVVSGEGNRLAVLSIEGESRLYVHRGHNSNEVLWVPLAALEPVRD